MDKQLGLAICLVCGGGLPEGSSSRRRYCSQACEGKAEYARKRPAILAKRAARYATDPAYRNRIKIHTVATKAHPDPEPCASCGEPGTDRHHPDDAEPTVIRWYCRRCHMRLHWEQKQRAVLMGIPSGEPAQ